MAKKIIEEPNGFDTLYYFVKDLRKRTFLIWWIGFVLLGCLLAALIPLGQWLDSAKDIYTASSRSFWIAALILAVGSAFFLAYVRRALLDARTAPEENQRDRISAHFLLDDVPLKEGQNDELERANFAETIAPLLALPKDAESIVVGLEAEWGEGKSSVLTLIEAELARHVDNPIIVRFNPWFVHSREQVLRAFFSNLIADIDESAKSGTAAVQSLRVYAGILQSIAKSTAGSVLEGFIDFRTKEKSLVEEKRLLSAALEKLNRPVVIIVDDIDRLPADDIRCIFQLVKIVCDFPRFSYLLAFDPAPVDRALQFNGLYENGRYYREKVIQLSIRLPLVGFSVRHKYFKTRIDQRIEAWKLNPDSGDQQTLDEFTNLTVRAVATARDIKRILNSWCLACNQLGSEVNHGDVLLMEILLMKFPKVFRAVEADPRQLVGAGVLTNDFETFGSPRFTGAKSKSDDERRTGLRKSLLEIHEDRSSWPLLGEILEALFPNTRVEYSMGSMDAEVKHKRVRDRDILAIYFGRRLPSGMISNKEIKEFFEGPSGRAGMLDDAVRSKSLGVFFVFLRKEVRAPLNPVDFVRRLCDAVHLSWTLNHDDRVEDAGDLLIAVLLEVDTGTAREMLKSLVTLKENAVVSERVISSILRSMGIKAPFGSEVVPNEESYQGVWLSKFPPDFMRSMVASWLETVESMGVKELIENQPNFMSVLYRWGQFGSPRYKAVSSALDDYIIDPTTATAFSHGFAPKNGISMGIDGVEELIVDPKKFLELLQSGGPLTSVLERFKERFGQNESPFA